MRVTLKMPKVGDAIDEVIVKDIIVKKNEKVSEGQTIFCVETDKTVVDVPSSFTGIVIDILIDIGDGVKTGAPTIIMET